MIWNAIRYVALHVFGHAVPPTYCRRRQRELALSIAAVTMIGLMWAAADASKNYFQPNAPTAGDLELRRR
jgi:hypothetical protein